MSSDGNDSAQATYNGAEGDLYSWTQTITDPSRSIHLKFSPWWTHSRETQRLVMKRDVSSCRSRWKRLWNIGGRIFSSTNQRSIWNTFNQKNRWKISVRKNRWRSIRWCSINDRKRYVGYLGLGFEYLAKGFAQEHFPEKRSCFPSRARRALS